jgi:Protein of unknown function (DUF3747)
MMTNTMTNTMTSQTRFRTPIARTPIARICGSLIAAMTIALALGVDRASAQMTQQELDPNGVAVVASPYRSGSLHQLLILEQQTSARACWSEQKTSTITIINPLLADFDFSGICGRATDSNGFSVRMGGRDLNWRYTMQVVAQNGDLFLIARNTTRTAMPDLLVGRVGGTTPGFAKIMLEPGWRITRRVAQGKLTGHFYLTNDRTIEQVAASLQQAVPATAATPVLAPVAAPVAAPVFTPTPNSVVSPTPVGTEVISVPPSPEVLK